MTDALVDRRHGTPAEQLRRDLERARVAGLPFDRAWDVAYGRVRWPHDTPSRQQWKATLAGQRGQWRSAYERLPRSRRTADPLTRLAAA